MDRLSFSTLARTGSAKTPAPLLQRVNQGASGTTACQTTRSATRALYRLRGRRASAPSRSDEAEHERRVWAQRLRRPSTGRHPLLATLSERRHCDGAQCRQAHCSPQLLASLAACRAGRYPGIAHENDRRPISGARRVEEPSGKAGTATSLSPLGTGSCAQGGAVLALLRTAPTASSAQTRPCPKNGAITIPSCPRIASRAILVALTGV